MELELFEEEDEEEEEEDEEEEFDDVSVMDFICSFC